jgi:hypothetical protein
MPAGRKLRRLGVLAATVAATAAIAAPAEGRSFDRHFVVVGESLQAHEENGRFLFREVLFNPANLNNRVGNLKGKCHFRSKVRCVVRFHFDGSIGGFGDLWARGNFGAGDSEFNVVDGTGTLTGKVNFDPVDRNTTVYRFHLTR